MYSIRITNNDGIVFRSDVESLAERLLSYERESRFWFNLEVIETPRGHTLRVDNVRLRQAKPYCTNKPRGCKTKRYAHKHKWCTDLEGADWVAFNDMVNDALDRESLAANIYSSRVNLHIRRGYKRRLRYTYMIPPTKQACDENICWNPWGDEKQDWGDYCLRTAPRSWCPPSTRGYTWWSTEDPDYTELQPVVTAAALPLSMPLFNPLPNFFLTWFQKSDLDTYWKDSTKGLDNELRQRGLARGGMVHLVGDIIPPGVLEALLVRDKIQPPVRERVLMDSLPLPHRRIRLELP